MKDPALDLISEANILARKLGFGPVSVSIGTHECMYVWMATTTGSFRIEEIGTSAAEALNILISKLKKETDKQLNDLKSKVLQLEEILDRK